MKYVIFRNLSETQRSALSRLATLEDKVVCGYAVTMVTIPLHTQEEFKCLVSRVISKANLITEEMKKDRKATIYN